MIPPCRAPRDLRLPRRLIRCLAAQDRGLEPAHAFASKPGNRWEPVAPLCVKTSSTPARLRCELAQYEAAAAYEARARPRAPFFRAPSEAPGRRRLKEFERSQSYCQPFRNVWSRV